MTDHIATDEQNAINEFIKGGKGHLLIDALAGTGKTHTLLSSLVSLPQKSALMCAFGKPIADELTLRMGKPPAGSMWKAATFHSLGLAITRAHHPRLDIRKEASEDLINDSADEWEAKMLMYSSIGDVPDELQEMPEAERRSLGKVKRVSFVIRRAAVKLLRLVKDTYTERKLPYDVALVTAELHNVFGKLNDDDKAIAVVLVQRAYVAGQDLPGRSAIDFCDMTWLPVVLDLAPPSRYQVVFVDEAQDLSLPQLKLVKKLVSPKGRLVVVGDLNQAIYKWRGAVGHEVWREMRETFQATQLPLTMTFRCSQAVVTQANEIVPALKARPGAPAGSVSGCSFEELAKKLREAWNVPTFVLSRNNNDLLHTALYLWKHDIGFQLLAGREIVEPLYEIIDKLDKSSKARFNASLATWYQGEMKKAESVHASAWADRIEQQYNSLMLLQGYAEPVKFKQILQDLINIGGMSAITLSTVHKVKGLEADRVYLLKETFARHRYRRQLREALDEFERKRALSRLQNIDPEELNLEYVAITRAKLDLIWVDMTGASTETLAKLTDVGKKP